VARLRRGGARRGLGRVVALYHRSSASHQIHFKRQCDRTLGARLRGARRAWRGAGADPITAPHPFSSQLSSGEQGQGVTPAPHRIGSHLIPSHLISELGVVSVEGGLSDRRIHNLTSGDGATSQSDVARGQSAIDRVGRFFNTSESCRVRSPAPLCSLRSALCSLLTALSLSRLHAHGLHAVCSMRMLGAISLSLCHLCLARGSQTNTALTHPLGVFAASLCVRKCAARKRACSAPAS
jgi:hypothetical protein